MQLNVPPPLLPDDGRLESPVFPAKPVRPPTERDVSRRLAKLLMARRSRDMEALSAYEPVPAAVDMHESRAKTKIALGGNRCLGGCQEVYDPIEDRLRRVDEIDADFHVLSRDPVSGEPAPQRASRPFVKAVDILYRFDLSSGESLVATMQHRVVDASGRWVSMQEALDGRPLLGSSRPRASSSTSPRSSLRARATWRYPWSSSCGTSARTHQEERAVVSGGLSADFRVEPHPESSAYRPPSTWGAALSVFPAGARRWLRTAPGCPGGCWKGCCQCDGQPRAAQEACPEHSPSPVGVLGCSRCYWPSGGPVCTRECSQPCRSSFLPSTLGAALRFAGQFFGPSSRSVSYCSRRPCGSRRDAPRFPAGSSVCCSTGREELPGQCQFDAASHPSLFEVMEHDHTYCILGVSEGQVGYVWDFTVEPWANYECAGLVNANSGKTISCAWEVVAIAAGVHPHIKTPSGGARIYMLASDQSNIGDTIWPKLGHPGAFQIIEDERSRKWRPVRPDAEYDKAYQEKWRDAPPLIDPRLLLPGKKGIAWEAANREIPKIVRFRTGSSISFYTANSTPRRGFEIHGGWIDEEQNNEEWIFELYRGLMKSNGWLLYSATPQHGTQWLYKNWNRAASPHNDGKRIAGFMFLPADNPFVSQESKEDFLSNLSGDDREHRVRWEGGFALSERIVYAEFSPEKHVVDQFWPGDDWNRYLIADPGITTAAVLFGAIPPDSLDDGTPHPHAGEIHIYDELYLSRCGAESVAEKVAQRIDEDPNAARSGDFVAFIMDGRAGRQTQMGSGRTIQGDYREAFRAKKLSSRLTGSDFVHGSDNIDSREEALHRLLRPVPDGDKVRYKLRVHKRCRSLIWEFPQQTRKITKDGLVLKDREKSPDHAIQCLEYFSDYNPTWVYFRPASKSGSTLWEDFQRRKRKKRRNAERGARLGPPV